MSADENTPLPPEKKTPQNLARDKAREEKRKIKEAERIRKQVEIDRRRLIKEQEQKEKEEKRRLKDLEKSQKEEERRQKEEERKRKEDEKRKQDEERLQKELKRKEEDDEKVKRQEKQKSLFLNFFKPVNQGEQVKRPSLLRQSLEPVTSQPQSVATNAPEENVVLPISNETHINDEEYYKSNFTAFQVPKDTRLCPLHRVESGKLVQKMRNVDACLNGNILPRSSTYIEELKSGAHKPCSYPATWPLNPPEVLVFHENINDNPVWLKAKLFQFVENYRPAYFGTWRTPRGNIIGPRRPFARDEHLFDYNVDSDEEWDEDAEQAENISHSEGEDDEVNVPNGDEEEEDGFVVPHGYLSEDEGASDESEDGITVNEVETSGPRNFSSAELRKLRQHLLQEEFDASQKRQLQPLRATVWGVNYLSNAASRLNSIPMELDSLDPIRKDEISNSRAIVWSSSGQPTWPIIISVGEDETISNPGLGTPKNKMVVPETAIPDLIHLLHNNHLNKRRINFEFRMYWSSRLQDGHTPSLTFAEDCQGKDWGLLHISRNKVNRLISQLATRVDNRWQVLPEMMARYNFDPQVTQPPWKYVSDANRVEAPTIALAESGVKNAVEVSPKVVAKNISGKSTIAGRSILNFVAASPRSSDS